MSHNLELYHQRSKAKVPFSWELKPGVSRQDDKTGEIWKRQWKLPPPPCQSQTPTPTPSFRRHGDYSDDVLGSPLVICPLKPSLKLSKSREPSFRKNYEDPFLEALRKCGELSPDRLCPNKNDVKTGTKYKKKRKKRSLHISFWGKYSCKIGTDGLDTVSAARKQIPNQKKDAK